MTAPCAFTPLIHPLLRALGWQGAVRDIEDALPLQRPLDLQGFRDALANLGWRSEMFKSAPAAAPSDAYPLIYNGAQGPQLVQTPGDAASLPKTRGTCLSFRELRPEETMNTTLRQALRRFSPLFREITFLSLVIGVVALAPIMFNSILYDHVIASDSTKGMDVVVGGVLLALLVELMLRRRRNARLAWFGGRIDHFVSCSVFERLLFLPPPYTERASVSAQLARLRDFENVREFFTGPLATLFFEMPLVLAYLIAMAVVAQWLALVPLALVLCYVVLILIVNGRLKEYGRVTAAAASQRQELLLETVTKLRAIRLAGVEQAWQERYRKLSGQASQAAFRAGFAAQSLETTSYVLMTLGAIATLGFGVIAVIAGNLSIGGLVAAMMIIWRVIAPMQIVCASITRIQQLAGGTGQVQRLLNVPPEHMVQANAAPRPKIKGHISFHRVTQRYSADSEPALLGVTFEAKPGQVIAIRGRNGSGKSTILKMILGLYQPAGGSVRIDGADIRQFDPIALRQSISYIPQSADFFPGTVRENLSFADPSASDDKIRDALRLACALEEVESLPQGLDTPIEGDAANVSHTLRQRLNLARAYIRQAQIVLLDEASYSLGRENDAAFAEHIRQLRGKSTVIMVTHREDHMRMADILLVIDKGELTHAGPPDQVLNVLRGKKS